ncbi:MAG TPA: antitoxin MazE family protein [Xanthobacteraceae bacterium]
MKRKPEATPAQLRVGAVAPKAPRFNSPRGKRSRSATSTVRGHRSKSVRTGLTRPKSSREKVRAYRDRMRKLGMKLIQIWVPDPRSPYFAAQARRESRLIAQSPQEKDDQAFIDSITDWDW